MKNMLCQGTTCSNLQDFPILRNLGVGLDVLQLSRTPPAAKATVSCRLVA